MFGNHLNSKETGSKGAINIPASGNLDNVADTLNKKLTLFLYCTSGFRSSNTAEKLYDKGFHKLYNLRRRNYSLEERSDASSERQDKTEKSCLIIVMQVLQVVPVVPVMQVKKSFNFSCGIYMSHPLKCAKMTTIKNFEELEIWKMARELVNLIYSDFRACRDFGFRDQITRAGISIMNNISEGFCRDGDTEFKQFLKISKGSTGEVKNMYYIAEDQGYAIKETAIDRRNKAQRLINSEGSFIKYLKSSK